MVDESRIEDLLSRWEQLKRAGQTVSPEELCRDCPELLEEVRRRVGVLEYFDQQAPSSTTDDKQSEDRPEPAGRAPLPASLGRYRLEELRGEGGFGQVWRAFDPELLRTVAIKVPRPDRLAGPAEQEAFLAEARKVARLRHPAILPVHDVGRAGDLLFIVSEWVDGGDLARRIAADRPALREAVRLVAEVAEALHFAHLSGLVHRDVKPANILLDRKGNPLLTDFGLAVTEEELQEAGRVVMGTLPYMAPEQMRGETHQIDGRTDIYSLGVVLYELLTGRRPFRADSLAGWQEQILSREPRPLRSIDDAIPRELERICLTCLAKHVTQRYPTARDLADELRQWEPPAAPALGAVPATRGAIVAGTRSVRESTPPESTVAPAFTPLAFDAELARLGKDFVGRQWLDAELEAWLARPDGRVFFLTGDPGTGKSAYLAHVAGKYPQVAAYHFCVAGLAESLNPLRFVQSLAAQLAARRDDYRRAVARVKLARAAESDAGTLLRRLVADPLRSLPSDRPVLIVVDALDEALDPGPGRTIGRLLQERLDDLPAWVRLVVSARKVPEVLDLFGRAKLHEIEVTRRENLGDVADYLRDRFREPGWAALLRSAGADPETTARLIRQRGEGNFLYVIQVLEAIQAGQIDPCRPHTFPEGLVGIYQEFFERVFPGRQGYDAFRPVLDVLAAAREPLSAEQLAAFLDRDWFEIENDLQRLAAFFPERDGRYRACHKSLTDWLCGLAGKSKTYRVNLKAGHRAISGRLFEAYRAGGRDLFLLSYLPTHLLEAQRWPELETVLTDLTFVEARCAAGQGSALVSEYNAALAAWPGYIQYQPFGPPAAPVPDWQRECTQALKEALRAWPGDAYSPEPPGPAGWLRQRTANLAPAQGSGPVLTWLRMLGLLRSVSKLTRHRSPPEARHGPGDTIPVPSFPAESPSADVAAQMRQAEATSCSPIEPDVPDTAAGRVQAFAAFVATHSHLLQQCAGETIPIARNHASAGLVASRAEELATRRKAPWVARDARPPALPVRPACLRVLRGHTDVVLGVALSSDGTLAVSAGGDQTLRVWDVPSGECLAVLAEHRGGISGVALTPDGKLALSAGQDNALRVWDIAAGACMKSLRGHTGGVLSVAVTPDGVLAASTDEDNTLRIWDVVSGTCLRIIPGYGGRANPSITGGREAGPVPVGLADHVGKAHATDYRLAPGSVALTPDGRMALTAGRDGALRVWDVASGECLRVLRGHIFPPSGIGWASDAKLALSASCDQTLRLWDVASGECLRRLNAEGHAIEAVAATADCRIAVSGGWDGSLRAWDLASGNCMRSLPSVAIYGAALTPDGRIAATAHSDRGVRIWDLCGGIGTTVIPGHADAVFTFAWTPDGRQAFSASRDHTIRQWDLASGECQGVLRGHDSWVRGLALTGDGSTLISSSWDSSIRVWDVASGVCRQRLLGHEAAVCDVAITPDGRTALSASHDRTLRVWNLVNGNFVRALQVQGEQVSPMLSAALTADGQMGVSGGWDGSVWVWDLDTGACRWTLSGHTACVNRVALTPLGNIAVSASNDQTLRVWHIRSGQCRQTLLGHTGGVLDVSVTADGLVALSAGDDNTVRIWSVVSGKCLAVYHAEAKLCAVSPLWPGGRLACGTASGQIHRLELRNLGV
jgi:WD40 repeat protein